MENKVRIFLHPQRSFDLKTYHHHFNSCMKYCDEKGVPGMLISTSAGDFYDPWVMAQYFLQSTRNTSPIIAINPVYIHPFAAARMVVTLSELYNRKIYLNFVIGSNLTDLRMLGDALSHDDRYARMDEFITIFDKLLYSRTTFSFEGEYFTVKNVGLMSKLNEELLPEYFVSGHSMASEKLALKYKVLNVQMLTDDHFKEKASDKICALTVVCRNTQQEVESFLVKQFPKDRFGEIMYQRGLLNTDSEWKINVFNEATSSGKTKLFRPEPILNNYTADPCLAGTIEELKMFFEPLKNAGLKNYILTFYEEEDLDNFRALLAE